jgi:hypothetical protein
MAAPTARCPLLALAAVAAALMLLAPGAEAVWLDVPPSGTKCVSEEIQPNVVVVADYGIMFESHPTGHPTVAVKVRAAAGQVNPFSCSVPSFGPDRVRNFCFSLLDLDLGWWYTGACLDLGIVANRDVADELRDWS